MANSIGLTIAESTLISDSLARPTQLTPDPDMKAALARTTWKTDPTDDTKGRLSADEAHRRQSQLGHG
jgi:hypothetical protein